MWINLQRKELLSNVWRSKEDNGPWKQASVKGCNSAWLIVSNALFVRLFRAVLDPRKNERKVQRFPLCLPPPYREPPLLSTSLTKGIHLLKLVNLHWHHNQPKSPVFIVQCWWCTFYRFGQMYDISHTFVSLRYHLKYFHCLKNLLCLCLHNGFHPDHWQPQLYCP